MATTEHLRMVEAMRGNDLGLRIQQPTRISNTGSTILSGLAAALLITWSVWNDRPTQTTPPAKFDQPAASVHADAPALGEPILVKDRGELFTDRASKNLGGVE